MFISIIYVQLYYYLSPWALESGVYKKMSESVRELEKGLDI